MWEKFLRPKKKTALDFFGAVPASGAREEISPNLCRQPKIQAGATQRDFSCEGLKFWISVGRFVVGSVGSKNGWTKKSPIGSIATFFK